ncbi:hypothetical protein HDV00_004034 [Rhizophlyctis rosea]|nr:hypothetical protein HDV00_004034 [Rhizophlyctis rosea]
MASNGSLRNIKGSNGLPKFGLIVKNKSTKPTPTSASSSSTKTSFTFAKRVSSKNALGADAESDNDDSLNSDVPITDFSSLTAAAAVSSEQRKVNKELRAIQAQKARQAEEAQQKALEEDPTVYDYDGVYDHLKRAEKERKRGIDNPEGGIAKKARYMEGLLKAAAQRKIDLERADERKAQREREQEGEEFGDKERFVTQAFKEKQAELKRLEEEERRREEMEGDITKRGDLTGFYREILNRNDRTPVTIPAKPTSTTAPTKPTPPEPEDEDTLLKQNAIRSGLVQLNDSEEIVDKRQLLTGGLNITSRGAKRQADLAAEQERMHQEYLAKKREEEEQRAREAEKRRLQREQKERSRRLVIEQKEELDREKEREEREKKMEVEKKLERKATEEVVMSARERYLARKRAAKKEESSDED